MSAPVLSSRIDRRQFVAASLLLCAGAAVAGLWPIWRGERAKPVFITREAGGVWGVTGAPTPEGGALVVMPGGVVGIHPFLCGGLVLERNPRGVARLPSAAG